jgi:multidrug efflux pump subunit AcrB
MISSSVHLACPPFFLSAQEMPRTRTLFEAELLASRSNPTSRAAIFGLLPMALKGAGSEAYAPLARAILGGPGAVSVALTVFLVPAAYLLAYERSEPICD